MMRMFILVAIFACCAPAAAGTPPRQVFIAGDSTASHYGPERAPREGWGQQLQGFLDDDAYVVRNHAQSGRSSRSFIAEGWFDGMAKDMRSGDVLLIQFGHNDEKIEDPSRYNEPQRAFPQWLARYVAFAREKGATPILLTPLARRKFERDYLAQILRITDGNVTQAARLAKRNRTEFYKLLQRHQLDPKLFKNAKA